jgi:hypothetical protein
MVRSDRLKTKGLLFLIPFIITLHNDYTPVIDEVKEGFFVEEFLDSSVDNKVERRFVTPPHKLNFSVFFFLKLLFLCALFLLSLKVQF